jgi:hypothetical protein
MSYKCFKPIPVVELPEQYILTANDIELYITQDGSSECLIPFDIIANSGFLISNYNIFMTTNKKYQMII